MYRVPLKTALKKKKKKLILYKKYDLFKTNFVEIKIRKNKYWLLFISLNLTLYNKTYLEFGEWLDCA